MNAPAAEIVPLRGARAMIADKMTKSLAEAAQLTHHASADLTALSAEKARRAEEGVRLSIEDLLMASLVRALSRHPALNGTVAGREIRLASRVDLCVAIALPGGLLAAPAIFDAGAMDAIELRAARRDLAERARTGGLSVAEMTGGTFTLSNLGTSRVEHFTPILNAPQIGILGVGRATARPVMGEGGLELRPFVGLSLTFDHRAVDGAPAATFLDDLCDEIESCSS